MDSTKNFLVEVTQELLYNIVFEEKTIKDDLLSQKFQQKTHSRPMDFFGFGNKTGAGWFEFIKKIPGLKFKTKIFIADVVGDGNDIYHAYNFFNTTCLYENGEKSISVAKYREMILIECCRMMFPVMQYRGLDHFGKWKDASGNTPLHFIAALPGITWNCSTLVKYLLVAGVDPLAKNKSGQNFLHIIMGRKKAERLPGIFASLRFLDGFTTERVGTTKWFVEDRVKLLDVLSEELSQAQTSSLVTAQDEWGNTVMHEFAVSSPIEEENFDEGQICSQLLTFGAVVRISNNFGELPLHYAFNPSTFNLLIKSQSPIRARNDEDTTPILFMVKYAANLAFTQTSTHNELIYVSSVGFKRSFSKALRLFNNINQTLQCPLGGHFVWNPDMAGNVTATVILLALRLASYDLEEDDLNDTTPLRLILLKLLSQVLRCASSEDMKWKNNIGQSFLHVLLDVPHDSKHVIIKETEILESLQLLLNYGVDVNAVDADGRTPLDITYKHQNKNENLYRKCAEMLMAKGAMVANTLLLSSLNQQMSNLCMPRKTRKLRSCPPRHSSSARHLTDPNAQVAIVGKYRYSCQDSIGTGAFSNVFVAIKDENVDSISDAIECRAYALKRLDKAKINLQEIRREITTLLSISSKCENIIRCHDSVEDPFFQYLSLDLMDGDLNEFVTNHSVSELLTRSSTTAVQVAKEIINGLAFLHEQKFIHRDLKPGNILYSTDQRLHFKIADFGLTKNMSAFSTMTSTRGSGVAMAPGTRCWMAPELVSLESREHTKNSDVFSLGLVLYFLITLGKHPFTIENQERAHVIERNIEEGQIHLEKSLHPEAISLFRNLLKKDPSERPPANMLNQHPFLWSERKKIDFLKAVGDQPEAEKPKVYFNSELDRCLQKTRTGQEVSVSHWSVVIHELYEEMTQSWRLKTYRTDKLIDLVRFLRNAYVHKQGKSRRMKDELRKNIFLRKFPFLVLDVLYAVQELRFHHSRDNIREVLIGNT